jgi:acyl-coenzyme A thioesterase PaaI-like protein
MSDYPPPQHVLRDLRVTSWLESETHAHAEMPVDDVVRDASGAVSLGALVTVVDMACARVSFTAAHPHWIATADLSLATADRPRDGLVHVETRLARAGSKLISIAVDLHGAGTGFASFVRIPREASDVDTDRPLVPIGERMTMSLEGPPPTRPITDLMDLRSVDGAVELERSEYVRNSFRTINGGVMGFLVVRAAEDLSGMVGSDLVLRYLGQTKVGPARATATLVRQRDDHAVADVLVVDAGAADALLARATVTLTR